jgi:hypothetical protein
VLTCDTMEQVSARSLANHTGMLLIAASSKGGVLECHRVGWAVAWLCHRHHLQQHVAGCRKLHA